MGAFYSSHTGVIGCAPAPELRSLSVRPNPFVGSTVAIPAAGLVVYDAMGSIVERVSTGRFGAGLAAGVYFVRADGFSRTRVVKLAAR
jgi:hypothetical protein